LIGQSPSIAAMSIPSNPHLGRVVLWMTAAVLSFSTTAISIRNLSPGLSLFEILSIRSAFGIVILVALRLACRDLRSEMRPRRLGLHFVRNALHFAAQYGWALAITLLPFATVFSLETTNPVWTTLLAALLLGERLTPARIGAIVLGFVGVLIIVRPGLAAFQPAAAILIAATLAFAASNIATKKLILTESTFAIMFWMNAMQLPMGLAGSDPRAFAHIEAWMLPSIVGIGIAGLSAHYCLTNALRWADAAIVLPMDYMRIPLIAVIGWWFYGESVDIFVFIGAAVIISGILWNLHAETTARRP
jgi:drug/metabolite transporter (DMT)-like permease